jgi:hypothetical protein
MKNIEKLAIVVAILIILKVIASNAMLWAISHLPTVIGDYRDSTYQIVGTLKSFAEGCISIACAICLYHEAKRNDASPWIWCLFGLTSKLPAVIIFYVYMLYRQNNANKALQQLPRDPGGSLGG